MRSFCWTNSITFNAAHYYSYYPTVYDSIYKAKYSTNFSAVESSDTATVATTKLTAFQISVGPTHSNTDNMSKRAADRTANDTTDSATYWPTKQAADSTTFDTANFPAECCTDFPAQ